MQSPLVGIRFQRYIGLFIGALILLLPALINGYPILNPDDGTYISSGFLPETPFDRPIMYGLLLRVFSLSGVSLFIAAFFQCLLTSWVIQQLSNKLLREHLRARAHLWIVTVLGLLSSLSWIASELLPDILTALAALILYQILLDKRGASKTWPLYFLYTILVCTHISNVMILAITIVILYVVKGLLFQKAEQRALRNKLAMLLFLTLLSIASMGSAISKSKHVFMMGALLEQGILKEYLDDHCSTESYKICAFKDNLPPDANVFIWDQNSPLYTTGGWAENKPEYTRIITGTLTEGKFIKMHVVKSLLFSARQLYTFNVGDGNIPFDTASNLHAETSRYIPNDIPLFEHSRQQKQDFISGLKPLNRVIYLFVILSAAILAYYAIAFKMLRDHHFKPFFYFVLITVAVNVWDCATFAQINGRYGCRVMWLIPLLALVAIFRRVDAKATA